MDKYLAKKELIENEIERLKTTKIKAEVINPLLEELGSSPVDKSVALAELMRRPEITYDKLAAVDETRPSLPRRMTAQAEVRIKYEGYIGKQLERVEKFKRMENKRIPDDIDYLSIDGLRIEARQKLDKLRPESLGQAGRISGVSPADINVLLIYLERNRRIKSNENGSSE